MSKPHKKGKRGGDESDTTLTGRISINSRGKGFFKVEGQEQDVEIPAEYTNTALHGDTVKIKLGAKRKHFPQTAEVLEIVERGRTHFVGTISNEDGVWLLEPDDRRVYVKFVIHPKDQERAEGKAGYKALVELGRWNDRRKLPEGKIIEIIGRRGEHETEMRAVVLSQGFDYDFPPGVEEAAEAIKANQADIFAAAQKTHRDLRDRTTFTIDPWDAKDFDDALSVHKLDNGQIEVGIHIADVSTYVIENEPIDTEARERGTSIYLVDRTIPMLPEVLSNDLCSLNPGADKLAFSAVFTFDQEHKLIDEWFGQTIIKSDKRFNYEEAQEYLDKNEGPLIEELTIARDIARTIRAERFKEGAIAFETEEVKFKLDEDMKPVDVYRKTRQETNMMIEDWMLLANQHVAQRVTNDCKSRGGPCTFVYRIHESPDPDKIMQLAEFVKALGFELKHQHGIVTQQALNSLFKQIEGAPQQDTIEITAIRSMAKAIYSPKNIGHFGLAFKHYCHFTSPIRRYPDLMVHRVLAEVLAGRGTPQREYQKYERLATQSSEREIAAAEAERDSVKYKQVEYMSSRIGQTFDGMISGVTDFGVFVEEAHTKAEGLVRLRDLPDDYYNLDKSKVRLVGDRTGRTITLGDKVKIKLLATDLEYKTIDWKIVG